MEITRGNTGLWQIAQNKNVSNAVPLVMRFYLPPTAYGLHHLPLSYSVADFETYTGVTAGGEPHAHTWGLWNTNDLGKCYIMGVQIRADQPTISCDSGLTEDAMTGEAGGQHEHNITPNLALVAADCNDIAIHVDGVDRTTEIEAIYGTLSTTEQSDIDVFEFLDDPVLDAWHEVKIVPNGTGTPAGMCYMYAYLSPEVVTQQV